MWKKLLAEWRDKPQNEREYWQDMYLIKDLYPQYTKSSQNSTIRKQTTQLKTGPKTWTKTSPKKVYSYICIQCIQMTNKYVKKMLYLKYHQEKVN